MLPSLHSHDKFVGSLTFSPDGSKIVSCACNSIQVIDATAGAESSTVPSVPKKITVSKSSPDCPIISLHQGWFMNSNTGRRLGSLPVGCSYYGGGVQGSYYLGWTVHQENSWLT
jgi:WD40 repeat protein